MGSCVIDVSPKSFATGGLDGSLEIDGYADGELDGAHLSFVMNDGSSDSICFLQHGMRKPGVLDIVVHLHSLD